MSGWPSALPTRSLPLGRHDALEVPLRSVRPRLPVVLVLPGMSRSSTRYSAARWCALWSSGSPTGSSTSRCPSASRAARCVIVGSISLRGRQRRAPDARRAGAAPGRRGAARRTSAVPRVRARTAPSTRRASGWRGRVSCCAEAGSAKWRACTAGRRLSCSGSRSPRYVLPGLLAGALPEACWPLVTFVPPDEGPVDRCSAVARAAGVDRPVVGEQAPVW